MKKSMLFDKSLKYISKAFLSGFIFSNFLISCQKEKDIPLNEQFQYKLEKSNKFWELPEGFIKPSISFLDFNGDGDSELIVLNEADNKIYSFPKISEDSFSEDFSSSYPSTAMFNITDFTAKRFGEDIQSFLVDGLGKIYRQKINLGQNLSNISKEPILKISRAKDNDGMISSYDFLEKGTLDLLVAKFNKNQELRNVYKYEAKELPNGEAEGSFLYDNRPYFELPFGAKSFTLGDINNDGILDVLVLEEDNSVYLYKLTKN